MCCTFRAMTTTTGRRSYDDVDGWRAYQRFFPPDLRVAEAARPVEVWEPWGGYDVHVDAWRVAAPRGTVVLLHGAGGHGRLLGPLARAVNALGWDAVAPDLPLFGLTRVPAPWRVRYADWVRVAVDAAAAEGAAGRPVVLLGLSVGGRLAYDAAADPRAHAAAVVASNLLDPRVPAVRRAAARTALLAETAGLAALLPRRLLGLRVPVRWLTRLSRMSADPAVVAACAADAQGGGGRVPLGFFVDWTRSAPAVEPDQFRVCPVVLVQPAADT